MFKESSGREGAREMRVGMQRKEEKGEKNMENLLTHCNHQAEPLLLLLLPLLLLFRVQLSASPSEGQCEDAYQL